MAAAPPATLPVPSTTTEAAPTPTASGMDTPRRLRLLSLGVGGRRADRNSRRPGVLALAYSLYRAEADTNQLIRVQQIQTNLLIADATATNAFLVGGLEPPAQRAQYDAALTATGALIAQAARAQPADADALAALNQQVVAYTGGIEQACRQQPAGPAGRVPVPAVGQCPAPRRRPAHRRQPGLGQRRPGRGPDGVWIGLVFVILPPGPAAFIGQVLATGSADLQLRHGPGVGAPAGPAGRRRGAAGQPEQRGGQHPHR